jgi:Ser/Thr protein kinase RdoA (MazF antagonist)
VTGLLAALAAACQLDLTEADVLTHEPNLILRAGDNVVRVYRPGVTAERLADIQRVREDLRHQGVPIPALRSAGAVVVDGRVVEVEEYVEHDGRMRTPSRLLTGMPLLGRLHSLLSRERLVAVTDFDFMAIRPRLDDLALTLYFTDSELGIANASERIAALRPLVAAYDGALDSPLSVAERRALPWAIARQPLWGFGHWVVELDDEDAQEHARASERDLDRVLSLARDPRWTEAFGSR